MKKVIFMSTHNPMKSMNDKNKQLGMDSIVLSHSHF
jgi:hypothetical protein